MAFSGFGAGFTGATNAELLSYVGNSGLPTGKPSITAQRAVRRAATWGHGQRLIDTGGSRSEGGTPILSILKRAWVPLIVVTAVVLGGLAVERLRGVFGSDKIFSATGSSAEPLVPSHVKRVTYEVFGPGYTAGSVSYLNENAQPQQATFTGLPWTYTITTTIPAVIANVVAQGNSDNIGCRITVNGEVKDEQSSREHHAQTFCLVKAA